MLYLLFLGKFKTFKMVAWQALKGMKDITTRDFSIMNFQYKFFIFGQFYNESGVEKVWNQNAGLKSLLWKVPELNLAGKRPGVEIF